ncbi:hypothetical protein AAF712_010727 [Marasmius tenuissimus]|uniref:NAD-dependent epimerase/dehydratase domain-containing protein n=1 Tax=Marasmius tenuissimus TaxID=585030 RepID=A0ABR2ZLD0_9AGAR
MPAIQNSSKPLVLVTGATGYIAAWVVRNLLERGFDVRGTVRSPSKGQELLSVLEKQIPGYGTEAKVGKLDFVIVEDIAKEGAFDEAVKGVDAVEHVASPFHMNADDPNELIEPAVKGTVGILESVKKYGDKVKRVVITSSCAAVGLPMDKPMVFDENDWNDIAIRETQELGRKAPGVNKYRASKTLAEKAVWAFVSENSGLAWDVVVLNPPFVFGPATNYVPTPDKLGTSATDWYKTLMTYEPDAAGKSEQALTARVSSWVDVRDVAEAHVRALLKQEAGGNRIIVSAGHFNWQEWLDTANSLNPSPYTKHPLSKGTPGSGRDTQPQVINKADRAIRLLGISHGEDAEYRYKTREETTRDTLADFAARGW